LLTYSSSSNQRGIAPEAETYIVRVFDDDRNFFGFADGTAYSTDLIAAATICKEWGADIINASLGGESYNRIEEEFFSNLYHKWGILTVAAAGNGGDTQNVYPAAYEGVLSVGAVDESLNLAKFSTWDPSTTDVLAPGKRMDESVHISMSGIIQ
jgi:serine protease